MAGHCGLVWQIAMQWWKQRPHLEDSSLWPRGRSSLSWGPHHTPKGRTYFLSLRCWPPERQHPKLGRKIWFQEFKTSSDPFKLYFDEVRVNEWETYGFRFPKDSYRFKIKEQGAWGKTCFRLNPNITVWEIIWNFPKSTQKFTHASFHYVPCEFYSESSPFVNNVNGGEMAYTDLGKSSYFVGYTVTSDSSIKCWLLNKLSEPIPQSRLLSLTPTHKYTYCAKQISLGYTA